MTPRAQQSETPLSAHLPLPAFTEHKVEIIVPVRPVVANTVTQRPSILVARRRRASRRVNH